MKKLVLKLTALTVCIILLCTPLTSCLIFESEATQTAKKFLTYLEKGNKKAIKAMFAKEIMPELDKDDFNKGLEYMLSIYKGKLTDIEYGIGWGSRRMGSGGYHYNGKSYTVTTTKDVYYLFIDIIISYDGHADGEGLYTITLMRNEDYLKIYEGEKDQTIRNKRFYRGIYHPGWLKRTDPRPDSALDYLHSKYGENSVTENSQEPQSIVSSNSANQP